MQALDRLHELFEHPRRLRMPNLLIVGPTNNGKSMIAEKFRRDLFGPGTETASASQPILIVHGRLDHSVHSGVPQEIYDWVGSTDKEIVWLSNSAHCVAIDCERHQLFEVTGRFLERVFNPTTEA